MVATVQWPELIPVKFQHNCYIERLTSKNVYLSSFYNEQKQQILSYLRLLTKIWHYCLCAKCITLRSSRVFRAPSGTWSRNGVFMFPLKKKLEKKKKSAIYLFLYFFIFLFHVVSWEDFIKNKKFTYIHMSSSVSLKERFHLYIRWQTMIF